MLNRKFAIALAIAMVMAVLYGCSSNSGIKNDRDQAQDRADMAEGILAAVRTALTLPADADEAAIVAAINAATVDELVMIRTALDLPADANVAAIVAAINAATVDELVMIRDALDLAADADVATIVAAINAATVDELVMIRDALDLAADADVATICDCHQRGNSNSRRVGNDQDRS